jgi:alkylated DNA repair dioxygenase AlkB
MNTRIHILEGGILDFDPVFLPKEEADTLFDYLNNNVKWEQKHYKHYKTGELIPQPRMTAWYADDVSMSYAYSGVVQTVLPWLPNLVSLKDKLEVATGAKYNSVLLNLYRSNNDSVGLHADDEAVHGTNATIASVSLGDTRTFLIKRYRTNPTFIADENTTLGEIHSFNLSHGSLIVMSGTTQHYWKHEVPKSKLKAGPRINLTYRWFKCA